jgi:deoxycytidine triphosphate deaminase
MFIHSSKYLGPIDDQQLQPNATDITLDQLFQINEFDNFVLYKNGDKKMRQRKEIFANIGTNTAPLFRLHPGQYQFESKVAVEIPDGVLGWMVARSTLMRNGIFISSGIYDSGFKCPTIGGVLYVNCVADIEEGARIAQFITAKAETLHLYDGQYQENNGIT